MELRFFFSENLRPKTSLIDSCPLMAVVFSTITVCAVAIIQKGINGIHVTNVSVSFLRMYLHYVNRVVWHGLEHTLKAESSLETDAFRLSVSI